MKTCWKHHLKIQCINSIKFNSPIVVVFLVQRDSLLISQHGMLLVLSCHDHSTFVFAKDRLQGIRRLQTTVWCRVGLVSLVEVLTTHQIVIVVVVAAVYCCFCFFCLLVCCCSCCSCCSCCWLLFVVGCCLLVVVGCWLLFVGCLLFVDCWLLVGGCGCGCCCCCCWWWWWWWWSCCRRRRRFQRTPGVISNFTFQGFDELGW